VEIMLANGDVREARDACAQLEAIAASFDTRVPSAIAAQASAVVALAEGDAQGALGLLRPAFELWQSVEAPYEAARVRLLLGLACRALGDEESAGLEFAAARASFERLGAKPDLARVNALLRPAACKDAQGLTARELQVLRLVAEGETNKAIAARLGLSEKTIDRHVSNIFTKLDVPSRAAATAFAYRHKLL
ncbi:MAG: response regulator transcription factor, partial [Bacteroidota bacterium]|nr:response regulator transcription factor [Kiloniellaceae bacterium]